MTEAISTDPIAKNVARKASHRTLGAAVVRLRQAKADRLSVKLVAIVSMCLLTELIMRCGNIGVMILWSFVVSLSVSSCAADAAEEEDGAFSIYLAVGPVVGQGKVIQVNPVGKVLGEVSLPATPYGLAVFKQHVYASLPRAGTVVRIDEHGNVETVIEHPQLQHPLDVAVHPTRGDIVVTDNSSDVIGRANADGDVSIKQIAPSRGHLQNFSVAVTVAGKIVMSASSPRGTFLTKWDEDIGAPILAESDNPVAADPTSNQWAAFDDDGVLHVYDGELPVADIELPRAKPYRGGLLAYSPSGQLVIVQASANGLQFSLVDLATESARPMFFWNGDRLVDVAIGRPVDWVDAAPNAEIESSDDLGEEIDD